jgi:hypothetical protein
MLVEGYIFRLVKLFNLPGDIRSKSNSLGSSIATQRRNDTARRLIRHLSLDAIIYFLSGFHKSQIVVKSTKTNIIFSLKNWVNESIRAN